MQHTNINGWLVVMSGSVVCEPGDSVMVETEDGARLEINLNAEKRRIRAGHNGKFYAVDILPNSRINEPIRLEAAHDDGSQSQCLVVFQEQADGTLLINYTAKTRN